MCEPVPCARHVCIPVCTCAVVLRWSLQPPSCDPLFSPTGELCSCPAFPWSQQGCPQLQQPDSLPGTLVVYRSTRPPQRCLSLCPCDLTSLNLGSSLEGPKGAPPPGLPTRRCGETSPAREEVFGADAPFVPLPGKEEGQKGSGAGDREDEKTGVTGVGLSPPARDQQGCRSQTGEGVWSQPLM